MGILDKIMGKKKQADSRPAGTSGLAKGLDVQSDAERDASRTKMEDEMAASRASRDAAKNE